MKKKKNQLSETKLCMVRGSSANVPKAQGQKTGHKGPCLRPVRLAAGLKYGFIGGSKLCLFFLPRDQMCWCQKSFFFLTSLVSLTVEDAPKHNSDLINSKVGALYHQWYIKRTQRK